MRLELKKIAIIGQGLIGSSITRAIYKRLNYVDLVVTDSSRKVQKELYNLGLGYAKIAETNREAVADADLIILCVPVGQVGDVARDIRGATKKGAIISDVGSVKGAVIADIRPHLDADCHLVPAHPLAGAEHSGPASGKADLFVNRWCILTPEADCEPAAVDTVRDFWTRLGAFVEVMPPKRHDFILAITSHIPQLTAFSIFQTASRFEQEIGSEVIKFSAGGFRDFTRIAASNPRLWRDIFLKNREACLYMLQHFISDLQDLSDAIENNDGDLLVERFSKSRSVRRKVIDKEHVSLLPVADDDADDLENFPKPYSSD